MKKLKNIIDLIKTNNYARILIELFIGTSLFNVNIIFAILFTAIISVEVIFAKIEDSLLIYLFLSFFDNVLITEALRGSISRVIMLIIGIKLSIYIIKNKIKPNKRQLGVAIFFVISLIVGIITYRTLSLEVIIAFANIFIFLMFSMCIKIDSNEEMNEFIKKLFYTIVWASLISIFYGIVTNSFLAEFEGEKISYRFKGTYEPNFMSMFVNLGIVSLLFLKDDIKHKWLVYLGFGIMLNAIILTVSMTGIATLGIILVIYAISKRKRFFEEIKFWLIVAVITLIIFGLTKIIYSCVRKYDNIVPNSSTTHEIPNHNKENDKDNLDNTDKSITNRVQFLMQKLIEGDWDRISSGRIPLIREFVNGSFNRPIGNILLGNDMTVKPLYTAYLGAEECSHCSYIDFLYNFGVIGFVVISGYLFIVTKKNLFIGMDISNTKYKSAIKIMRGLVLLFALTLSLYTKRMVLIFFLL